MVVCGPFVVRCDRGWLLLGRGDGHGRCYLSGGGGMLGGWQGRGGMKGTHYDDNNNHCCCC